MTQSQYLIKRKLNILELGETLAAGPTRLSLGLRDSAQYNCGCSRRRVEFRGLFENTG